MKNSFKYIHISLNGVNLSRIYKECKKNDIELYNIDRKDYKNIEFDIKNSHKKALKIIAKSQRYEYREDSNFGFLKLINFLKFRFGILIGVLFFVIANIFSSFFVWDIKIYGNRNVTNDEILQVLKNQNICVGGVYKSSNLENIETTLTNSIESISLCSVIKKGTSIIVNIKEKLDVDDIISINADSDIVATTNLTIIDLNVVSGTALKKIGDSVMAGETIVASYILNCRGEKVPCKANAKIKAKTWHTCSEEYYKTVEINTRTGRVIKNSYLTLFSMKFNSKNNKINFENYEEETKEILLTKNNFLPFKHHVSTYYEVVATQTTQDFEKDKQNVIERCQKNAYKQVSSKEEVTNIFDIITEQEDRYIVTSYVEVIFEF